jgi:uncharacterized protein YndB with AHSA1/START domain
MMSADGTVIRKDGRTLVRYERSLRHAPERVWQALTDPKELSGWLAEADFEQAEGGRVELRWLNTDDEGNSAVARGTVTAFDPPRLLELDTDIHGRLRWELSPESTGGCALVFIADISHVPSDFKLKVLAGWHVHLDFLVEALDGRRVDWPNWPRDRWRKIHDGYAAKRL